MSRNLIALLGLVLGAQAHAATTPTNNELRDLFFGEALFYAYQGEHFEAISTLDAELAQYHRVDEPELDSLHYNIDDAEFSVGDFELSYRMHQRAGRAITAVLEADVDQAVRNEAAFRLARIYFQKEQPVNALHTLERIQGKVPERIRDDLAFLKAQVYMTQGQFAESVKLLNGLSDSERYAGFSAYNRGIALLQQGEEKQGLEQLDKAGLIGASDRATLAIRDKANLMLASRLLENQQPAQAKQYFERVRLKGPFSARALLGSGWADASLGKYDRALVPWNLLVNRNVTDKAVQEGMLAAPFAYGKLNLYGKAALMYGSALEAFGRELNKLDSSIKSIREGKFLKALVREELKQDKNWVIKLRNLPEAPETYYLMDLMASNDFQESLKNYLDLEELRKRLSFWGEYYDSYEEIIAIRHAYYEPLLPGIDKQFRVLDSRIKLRTGQRDSLEQRLQRMLVSPRPDFLATSEERRMLESLARIEKRLKRGGKTLSFNVSERLKRLRGVIQWRLKTEYDARLTETFEHLKQLDEVIAELKSAYNSFVRTRQAATQSYQGYDDTIRRLRIKTLAAQEQVKALMARQGHMLEVMAANELDKRRKRLEEYQVKARFALAESYDRATKAQTTEGAAQ